ncbi:hypothetical protein KEJ27_02530 [Candidatus Bathyarchaeota archaeon]|nr:hypothetical protein [Candidatus Bathyarchaeota archaeon]MBS7613493.1 hypothetical protein [Candidatus Bathyarchaeota archaeon]MBS7618735.1 hypothetical protein [Candidatus Bathyarchaeota archaeon]
MDLFPLFFILRLFWVFTVMVFKFSWVFLKVKWRRWRAVKAFRKQLMKSAVPKREAIEISKNYISINFRDVIRLMRSLSTIEQ